MNISNQPLVFRNGVLMAPGTDNDYRLIGRLSSLVDSSQYVTDFDPDGVSVILWNAPSAPKKGDVIQVVMHSHSQRYIVEVS